MASVRHIVPGVLKDEELLQPIAPGFSSYPADSFEFIVGTAEKVDTEAKTVLVAASAAEQKALTYDQLVLATGTRCAGDDHVPWKADGSYEEVIDLLHKTQENVKAAKHIVVAGAGATGVETAAELGFEYKDKEIVLLSGAEDILGGDSIASNAGAELKKLGVKIQNNAHVTGTVTLPDGKTEISLQSGDKITTDVYLPTIGVIPNTEYLDAKHLRSDKYVDIDQFYKVKGTENVWAAGDIVCKPRPGFVITEKQVSYTANTIVTGLSLISTQGSWCCEELGPCPERARSNTCQGDAHRCLCMCHWPQPNRRSFRTCEDLVDYGLVGEGKDTRGPACGGLCQWQRLLGSIQTFHQVDGAEVISLFLWTRGNCRQQLNTHRYLQLCKEREVA